MVSRRVVIAVVLILAGLAGFFLLRTDDPVMSAKQVEDMLANLGRAGPFALIGLMVIAIVVSPVPSGPIAVAAGALYGTVWGGVFSILGASMGAFAAFGAARYLGFDAIRQSQNPVLKYIAAPRSQFSLMLIVFGSRLIPFISFDAVSYAAGLTCLSFGRFAVATCLGVVPICFALAAMGAGMVESGTDWMLVVALGGAVTLFPIAAKWVWERARGSDRP